MRLILPVLLLGLSACDPESAPPDRQATLEQHERQGREVVKPGEIVAEAGPGAADAAPGTGAAPAREAEDPDAAVAPKVPAPQQAEAQTSSPAPPSGASAAPAPQSAAFLASGRELVQTKCATCHSIEVALAQPRSAAGWAEIMESMVGHGMVASQAERRLMLEHLETCC